MSIGNRGRFNFDPVTVSPTGTLTIGGSTPQLTSETGTVTVPTGVTLAVPGTDGLQVGDTVPFLDEDGALTLQNVDALEDTTTATILSKMTTETQHHIGCLTVSDMNKVKTLFMTTEGAGPISMRHRDVWYSLPIVEITGDWAAGTAIIKVANDTATDPKLPYGYLQLVNNYTSEDTLTISGSTLNDGTYTLRANATADEVEGEETFIYIKPDADAGEHDATVDGDAVSIQDLRYMVPTGKVFLAGRVSSTLTHGYTRGLIGESDTYNGTVTKPQMCFGNGASEDGHLAGEVADIPGVFTAGKYVNVAVSGSYGVYMPTLLYGVEVSVDEDGVITDDVTVQFDIGGYLCEDYRDLKVLIAAGDIGSGAVSFHAWDDVEEDFETVYEIGDGKVYIAGSISYWKEGASGVGTIGESATDGGTITKKIFCCGNTDVYAGLDHVYGMLGYSPVDFVGASGKFVSAVCSQYNLRAPTYIYGVEIDA